MVLLIYRAPLKPTDWYIWYQAWTFYERSDL